MGASPPASSCPSRTRRGAPWVPASRTYEGTPPPDAGWLFPGESRAEGSAVDSSGNVLLTGSRSGRHEEARRLAPGLELDDD